MALPDILEEGQRLVELARASNVTLRLLGGVGIALRCPSEGDLLATWTLPLLAELYASYVPCWNPTVMPLSDSSMRCMVING
jgi:hypothetical protein